MKRRKNIKKKSKKKRKTIDFKKVGSVKTIQLAIKKRSKERKSVSNCYRNILK